MEIREAVPQDLEPLLTLYTHLHDNPMPAVDTGLTRLWESILADPNHHILVAEEDGLPVSSCVLLVVPNLTHGQRPYALVENVVTHPAYRRRGIATRLLSCAGELAEREGCYKMMLLTGAKEEATLRFYEGAGFNRRDKTAFIRWLE